MSRFVQYNAFGDPSVLEIVEGPMPEPGPGEVRVRVQAAGLNPFETALRSGAIPALVPSFPAGAGSDFAGVVDAVGEGVDTAAIGDDVLGGAFQHAIADAVVVPAAELVRRPAAVPVEVAGALDLAGRTAWFSVDALGIGPGDTVLLSAAAGGVGVIAAQLATGRGATVIGTAGEGNHEFLRSLGVIPVAYGDGLAERVRELAPQGLTAVLDYHGRETVEAGLALGVPPERINTVVEAGLAAELGLGNVGSGSGDASVLAHLVEAVEGGLQVPIEAVFPIERAADAYRRLERRHLRGKIVVVTG